MKPTPTAGARSSCSIRATAGSGGWWNLDDDRQSMTFTVAAVAYFDFNPCSRQMDAEAGNEIRWIFDAEGCQ